METKDTVLFALVLRNKFEYHFSFKMVDLMHNETAFIKYLYLELIFLLITYLKVGLIGLTGYIPLNGGLYDID